MSGPAMLAHMLLERISRRTPVRVPEPELVMEDAAQIEAFHAGGREDGVLAPIYLFHALQAGLAIRAGDTVLDLACGPANQLVQLARLHPEARFIGIDLSPSMLALAHATLERCGVGNVSLLQADMLRLDRLADASVDAVTCTLSLHHLPDAAALQRAMTEAARVLRPGGGVYLTDFGLLKRPASQRYFAHDRSDLQTPQFTLDYLNSMRAAFSVPELSAAAARLGPGVVRHQTALAPFMVIFRRTVAGAPAAGAEARARAALAALSQGQRQDFRAFSQWFRAAGLALPHALGGR